MWTYQNGAQVLYFLKVSKHFEKINFRTFFSDSEVQELGFSRFRARARNPRKNREKSQIGPGRPGKLGKPSQTFFSEFRRSLGSKWVVYQPRTTIFEEIVLGWNPHLSPFWSLCGYVTSQEKNLHFLGNTFFATFFSGKCILGSSAGEILVFK